MSTPSFPFFDMQFFDNSGRPLSNGTLTFLVGGSTNLPKNVYYDTALTIPTPNPLTLDASGKCAQIFPESGSYKIIRRDNQGVIIKTSDFVDAYATSGSGGLSEDTYQVKTNTFDTTPGFLYDKIEGSSTISVTQHDIGGHDYLLKLDVNQDGLNNITPSGPAGGDLAGTYPDPIVKQLTGLDTGMIPKTPGFSYDSDIGMTGIGAGNIFVNGVEKRAWGAITFSGYIRWSIDDWESALEDNSLIGRCPSPASWNAFSFIKVGSDYYWVAGNGYERSFYMAKHIPDNYNLQGKIYSSAWNKVDYPYWAGTRYTPPNVGDIASANGVTLWVGFDVVIGRTTDFSTFTSPPVSEYEEAFGGIATDNYDTWMVVTRDTGKLHISKGNGGTSFDAIDTIYVDGVLMDSLPRPYFEKWGSLLCSYGTWVAAVYSGKTGHISYAYSTDTINWTTVTNSDISFFSAASNGVSWFATNPVKSSINPIYQLLISEIPAHKKLIAEKGLAVAGNVNLVDIPNAQVLSTDSNGLIIATNSSDLGGKVIINSSDPVKQYLNDKIIAGNGIDKALANDPAGFTMTIGVNGKTIVGQSDLVWDYLDNKILPGAGITITESTDSTHGTRLIINAKGNSWRLIRYVSDNTTVLDTDDTLIIRATGVSIAFPTPSSDYEGRIVTVRCSGGSNSGNVTGSIIGSSTLSGIQKLELCCFNTGSGYFWVQQ